MKKFTKIKTTVIALTLVACLAVAGVSAYFTDAADVTNTFTIGEVSLVLTEPEWEQPVVPVTPNQTLEKDPQITNDGENCEYVFLTVEVPYANVVVAEANGTKKTQAETELVSYTLNAGWVEIGTGDKNATTGTITHTYAYAANNEMTALAKDATTTALFNEITIANLVEGQNDIAGEALENSVQNVVINAYGIQSENIGDSKAPADVWEIVCNQREM